MESPTIAQLPPMTSSRHSIDGVETSMTSWIENSTIDEYPTTGCYDNEGDATHMSLAEVVAFAIIMSCLIVVTIVGNILVVLSVFTYGPLKTVPNFFVASLAGADLTVAILVMPFSVPNFVIGRWTFGPVWCQAWLTFDILTCTASILHLCAIALDRYHAIHDPIAYALQRTRRRVIIKIAVVWALSAVISIPPLIGWNGGSLYNPVSQQCQLTDDRGFVVYSAAGSFYIPLAIMTVVYARIFRATRARLRARARATAAARLRAAKAKPSATSPISVPVMTATVNVTATTVASGERCGGERRLSATGTGNGNEKAFPPELTSRGHIAVVDAIEPEKEFVPHDGKRYLATDDENNVAMTTMSLIEPAIVAASSEPYCQRQHQHQTLLVPGIDLDDPTVCSSSMPVPRVTKDSVSAHIAKDPVSDSGRKTKNRKRYSVPKGNPVNRQLYEFMEEKQRISLSKERRAARTMAIIMGAFVACWLPFFLMYVIFPFCNWCAASADFRLVNFIVWLGYVNSALNPVIYTVFNVDFRRAFQNLLTGRCRPSPG